jgi:hypothetical protein
MALIVLEDTSLNFNGCENGDRRLF